VFNSVCPLLDTDNASFHRNPEALQIAEKFSAECLIVAGEQGVNLNLAEVIGSLLLNQPLFGTGSLSPPCKHPEPPATEIATLNLAIGRNGRNRTGDYPPLLGQLTLLKFKYNNH